MRIHALAFAAVLPLSAAVGLAGGRRARAAAARAIPGRGPNETLLPNGWRIAPVGRHIQIGDLPLAMAESPDGKYLLVTNNGFAKPTLAARRRRPPLRPVHDLARQRMARPRLERGRRPRLHAPPAKENAVRELRYQQRQADAGRGLSARRSRSRSRRRPSPSAPIREQTSFVGGLALDPAGGRLYAVNVLGQTLSAVDLASGALRIGRSVALPAEPYTCLVSPDGRNALRLALGRLASPPLRPGDARAEGRDRDGRASERDGALPRRRDALRGVREHELGLGGGRRGAHGAGADLDRPRAEDAAGFDAQRARSLARRPHAPRRERGQQLRRRGGRLAAGRGAASAAGSRPAGIRRAPQFSRDGKTIYVLSGKGLVSIAEPARTAAGDPGGARASRRATRSRARSRSSPSRTTRRSPLDGEGPRADALPRREPARPGARAPGFSGARRASAARRRSGTCST